jgi:hypothetical protein
MITRNHKTAVSDNSETDVLWSHFGRVKTPTFQAAASAFLFLYLRQLRCLWQYVISTAFIRDFLIGEADIASFSCYSKPPASAGGTFTLYFKRVCFFATNCSISHRIKEILHLIIVAATKFADWMISSALTIILADIPIIIIGQEAHHGFVHHARGSRLSFRSTTGQT